MVEPTIIVAFIAGIVSFASPCVLPLIPGFLAYLSGTSAGQQNARLKVFLNSVAFVLGFSVFFALYILGLIKISFLEREHKLAVKKKFSVTYATSFVFGAAFAVGWTPCVSAILGRVFALVIAKPGLGFVLLMSYALGLGVPFLLVGLFTTQAVKLINKSATVLKYFNIIVGVLLLILGILVFTNKLNVVANWFFAYSLLS